jgi:hypothetical protein
LSCGADGISGSTSKSLDRDRIAARILGVSGAIGTLDNELCGQKPSRIGLAIPGNVHNDFKRLLAMFDAKLAEFHRREKTANRFAAVAELAIFARPASARVRRGGGPILDMAAS